MPLDTAILVNAVLDLSIFGALAYVCMVPLRRGRTA